MAITETWLRPGNADEVKIGTLCPTGYRFLHVHRSHSKGGGVGILFKDNFQLNTSIAESYQIFELMDVRLRSLESIRIIIVYRPPDSSSLSLFMRSSQDYWSTLQLIPAVAY